MTNKDRIELLLDGGVPDFPPTWELVFQNSKEFFGIDPDPILRADHSSPAAKHQAGWAQMVEVYQRLIDECGWGAVRGGYDPDEVGFTKRRLDGKALVAAYDADGVFWMPTGDQMMDFAIRLFEQPKELHEEAREKCDRAKEMLVRHVDAGADFFVLTYDFGYNHAPFVSPAQFREFVAPYLTEMVAACHDLKRKVILHSDGCLNVILDQIHATGVDGYQSVDPQGNMDIRQVRKDYPDWLLMGNVKCSLLQDGTEAQIRESVQYCMEHGGIGHRYIFSTSNCIFEGMPPDSYRIMLDEYRQYIARAKARGDNPP